MSSYPRSKEQVVEVETDRVLTLPGRGVTRRADREDFLVRAVVTILDAPDQTLPDLAWANTQPPTASRQATTRAAAILHGHVRTIDPRSSTVMPSCGPRAARRPEKTSAHLRAPL